MNTDRVQAVVSLALIFVILAAALTGCGGAPTGAATSAPVTAASPAPAGSTAAVPAAAAPAGKLPIMGTAVPIGDASLSAERMTRSVGDQVSRAKRGRTWAMVTVAVTNNSAAPIEVNPADFSVKTSGGETQTADPDVHFLPMLKTTSLEAGKSVEGRLGFDVPEKDDLVLTWTPKWAPEKSVSINLVKK